MRSNRTKRRPKKILEVGVDNGGSSAVILQCMKDLGYPACSGALCSLS